jgi:hypothetical protein
MSQFTFFFLPLACLTHPQQRRSRVLSVQRTRLDVRHKATSRNNGDRERAVGIATRYGLDGPVIESRLGEVFRAFQTGPKKHPASCTITTGSFLGVKLPERGADHIVPSNARLGMGWNYSFSSQLRLRTHTLPF